MTDFERFNDGDKAEADRLADDSLTAEQERQFLELGVAFERGYDALRRLVGAGIGTITHLNQDKTGAITEIDALGPWSVHIAAAEQGGQYQTSYIRLVGKYRKHSPTDAHPNGYTERTLSLQQRDSRLSSESEPKHPKLGMMWFNESSGSSDIGWMPYRLPNDARPLGDPDRKSEFIQLVLDVAAKANVTQQ